MATTILSSGYRALLAALLLCCFLPASAAWVTDAKTSRQYSVPLGTPCADSEVDKSPTGAVRYRNVEVKPGVAVPFRCKQAASPPGVTPAGYAVKTGKIFDAAGHEVQLRGISHHGFNGSGLQPQNLWNMNWQRQIAHMKELGFNAIRLPFVPDTLYAPASAREYVDARLNPDVAGLTPLQFLDRWMEEADRQGMYILLDFHSVSKKSQYFHPHVTDPNDYSAGKWVETYNQRAYTSLDWVRDLKFVATRYAKLKHFIGIDIFNEPRDRIRWTTTDPALAGWKPLAESAASAILTANPNLLIFVQGITANFDGKEKQLPLNWGENLQPQAYAPLNIPATKLVFAPHSYGPSVYMKTSFTAPNFPNNLAADWETLFGFLSPKFAVTPGEWGGRFGFEGDNTNGLDKKWGDAFIAWMASKKFAGNWFWCYTNSGDTGAILDDNLNVIQGKMDMIKKSWGL